MSMSCSTEQWADPAPFILRSDVHSGPYISSSLSKLFSCTTKLSQGNGIPQRSLSGKESAARGECLEIHTRVSCFIITERQGTVAPEEISDGACTMLVGSIRLFKGR